MYTVKSICAHVTSIVSLAMVLEGGENALCGNSVQHGKISPQYEVSQTVYVFYGLRFINCTTHMIKTNTHCNNLTYIVSTAYSPGYTWTSLAPRSKVNLKSSVLSRNANRFLVKVPPVKK